MPVNLNLVVKPLSQSVHLAALEDEEDLVAWWYCGLYKNRLAESQPNALVAFRKLVAGSFSDDIVWKRVPLTSLGQVRIGSIWNAGQSRSMIEFPVQDFDVDFRPEGWRFTSFENFLKGGNAPFPPEIYPLPYKADKNFLLEFKLPSEGSLIVPCLEFFSRCYGRSQELKRILATYPWHGSEEASSSRLYAPLEEPEEASRSWKVKLRRRLHNGDITFLAHAKYDPYTTSIAKSIYAELEKNYDPNSKAPMFIKTPPWFQGPAEIRARGIWFNNNRSFLALQIEGSSDPDGIAIERDRENTNKTDGVDPENDKEAWGGVPERILVRPPDIVDLTGDYEPNHTAGVAEILDSAFVVLGIPRVIRDIHGKRITSKSGKKGQGNASAYSSGEPHGTNKGVGYASIHARPIIESNGALLDMWNALVYIQEKHADVMKPIEWFTFERGYVSGEKPNLIGLETIDEVEEPDVPTITRNWIFHDVPSARVRGVMIVRIIVSGVVIHLAEIQRRPRTKREADDTKKESEESFKGFIIALENPEYFSFWLESFLSDIRYVRGIFQKITATSPGKADTFTHRPSANENVPCEGTVLNALAKMGIKFQ